MSTASLPPFDAVVRQHGAAVLRLCRTVAGVHDAEDVWSETFLAALRAYPALPADTNVEAWLVTIARRKSIDALRAAGRRPVPVETVPERGAHEATGDPDLVTAVAALPLRQREAIAFHYLVGLPYAQVAEIVGGSEPAARRAAADGMKALRRTYRPALEPSGGGSR
ncbi:RNA polymerase sigma factor [Sanguibacter antarcticus]|uniref:RNA polymerase sigma factor (Sigma-70 family) n=1 Tax=Sanguibacter antarcticus TaxID=372484 RepID=A0A2A9E201_9MICO|nr:RNA polymerase sigma factor [Sanguibacter antarcticus]PFG32601.1 RNA polymerase sigma factor (sigma-70 family) [Sanguibacter antarcticus]